MKISQKTLRGCMAYTLMELVVTFGIATMFVLWVMTFTTITFQQGIFSIGNYSDLNSKSRQTLDYLSMDIRNAAQLIAFQTNSITLTNNDGTSFSYNWDGSNAVTRTYAGRTSMMMSNCDYLSFNIYQRNPTNNYSFVTSVGNINQTKLIDVSWRCSRQYLGKKLNTESVQTARIVMRN